ncbi:MAG: hypothetical protein C5B55_03500 [Blastocatellia bacterium]|nr:MAG: hypothetical protein C5B55_03500 [Blastocatellia bacterium]
MKKRNKQKRNTGKRHRWPLLIGLAIVVLAVAAITVISRQSTAAPKAKALASAVQAVNNKRYVTVKVGGRDVQVDSQTGQIRPLTPEEAQQLADGLKKLLNKSTDGLVQEHRPDGSVSMDLQGRFQNVVVARTEADGTVTQSCVDEPEQAAKFFGIDPALMGVEPKANSSSPQIQRTPAKRSLQ